MAAAMLEPGVVRFGLGPLTEVVAQHHTFAELAPHLDTTLLPVVAQERVLRGEDLRDDARAHGEDDDPPLVLQPFEPDYVLPEYRAAERLDGAVPDPSEDAAGAWRTLDRVAAPVALGPPAPLAASAAPDALLRALEDVVAPWASQSGGELHVAAVRGSTLDACCAVLDLAGGPADAGADAGATVRSGEVEVATLLRLLAFAGASGGVHGRRRGGAAGRAAAWWVARCATGLHRTARVDAEELEFRLEDLDRRAFRIAGEATWRLELAIGSRAPGRATSGGPSGAERAGAEWAVAIAAFDRAEAEPDPGPERGPDPGPERGPEAPEAGPGSGRGGVPQVRPDPASW